MRPCFILIAGPNGAGKTTFARTWLPTIGARFVNADDIARELAPEDPDRAALAAGRRALATIAQAIAERADVAVETTLAGCSHLPLVERARAAGYDARLWFLYLASPELALLRVAERVRMGGHAVAEEVIRRRYAAGLRNLFGTYRAAVDGWYLYDTSEGNPVAVAAEEAGRLTVLDEARYERVRTAAEHTHDD